MQNRSQLIEEIRQVNHGVESAWLDRFPSEQLHTYLEHLRVSLKPRGRSSAWTRPTETPAIIAYVCSE